ncbi:hypothetical protein NR798_03190 [Archangium gephyra]|uniref:hypothetical protein n=1 Tax=Archangium gephyra TaxID=48 RepID=UPI0035D49138
MERQRTTGYGERLVRLDTPEDRGRVVRRVPPRRSSIVAGTLWMVFLSLLLVFLPLVNGFVGGLVGGYKVGTVGRALTAAVLPAVLIAAGIWVLFTVLHLPLIGLLSAAAIGVAVALSEVGLFLGAALGGLLRANRGVRREVIV